MEFPCLNWPNWEVTCIIPIFGSFLVKILVFDPRGADMYGYPPLFCDLFWRNSITLRVKCDFFDIWYCLKVRNCIIWIFRPFFGPNVGVWPPGVTYGELPPGVVIFFRSRQGTSMNGNVRPRGRRERGREREMRSRFVFGITRNAPTRFVHKLAQPSNLTLKTSP